MTFSITTEITSKSCGRIAEERQSNFQENAARSSYGEQKVGSKLRLYTRFSYDGNLLAINGMSHLKDFKLPNVACARECSLLSDSLNQRFTDSKL
jgi:hypothetical protein